MERVSLLGIGLLAVEPSVDVEAWASLVHIRPVTVTEHDDVRILAAIIRYQAMHRRNLLSSPSVLGIGHVRIHPTNITDADVAGVVLAGVCTLLGIGQATVSNTVERYNPVVGDLTELGDIPLLNSLSRDVAAFRSSGTMNSQVSNGTKRLHPIFRLTVQTGFRCVSILLIQRLLYALIDRQ